MTVEGTTRARRFPCVRLYVRLTSDWGGGGGARVEAETENAALLKLGHYYVTINKTNCNRGTNWLTRRSLPYQHNNKSLSVVSQTVFVPFVSSRCMLSFRHWTPANAVPILFDSSNCLLVTGVILHSVFNVTTVNKMFAEMNR